MNKTILSAAIAATLCVGVASNALAQAKEVYPSVNVTGALQLQDNVKKGNFSPSSTEFTVRSVSAGGPATTFEVAYLLYDQYNQSSARCDFAVAVTKDQQKVIVTPKKKIAKGKVCLKPGSPLGCEKGQLKDFTLTCEVSFLNPTTPVVKAVTKLDE